MGYKHTFMVAIAIALGSCSNSSDNGNQSSSDTLTGIFVDSAVQGLSYQSASEQGVTSSTGSFNYRSGESITFNIGDLIFPTTLGMPLLTPVELASGSTNAVNTTTNIARLLQSIDEDGDTSNGITISPSAALVATPLNFDVTIEEFETNPDVINFIANSGSSNVVLIPASTAMTHLASSIRAATGSSADSSIAGYWFTSLNSDYISISEAGVVIFYDNDVAENCYTTKTGTIEQIDATLYLLTTDDGAEQQLVITRDGDTLNILFVDSFSLVTDSDPSALQLCI